MPRRGGEFAAELPLMTDVNDESQQRTRWQTDLLQIGNMHESRCVRHDQSSDFNAVEAWFGKVRCGHIVWIPAFLNQFVP